MKKGKKKTRCCSRKPGFVYLFQEKKGLFQEQEEERTGVVQPRTRNQQPGVVFFNQKKNQQPGVVFFNQKNNQKNNQVLFSSTRRRTRCCFLQPEEQPEEEPEEEPRCAVVPLLVVPLCRC